MAYVNVYSSRINWENEPNISTPLNATNLNKMDYALYQMDGTFATWDTTKADESDLLLCVKSITYDTDTGVFVFTWQNGTTYTVDLNIEKIPVSFSMDANGVITMTTEDGSTYTADVGALIKTYTFTDSTEIDFTVTTDADGNKTVTAGIVAGSIDGTKLVPNYLSDCQNAKTGAETAEGHAEDSAEDAEAWAVGERNGVPVTSGDETYENNAKYWASQSGSLGSLQDVSLSSVQDGQTLVYDSNSSEWKNADIVDADAVHWEDNSILGAKNLLRKAYNTSTIYGITFTVNDNGSIVASGIATSEVYWSVYNYSNTPELQQGSYIVSGGVAQTDNYTFYLQERNADNTGWGSLYIDATGNGVLYTRTTDVHYGILINIKNGTDLTTPITFYPMIRLATDTDDTYQPYSMTNQQLTEKVKAIDVSSTINTVQTAYNISSLRVQRIGQLVMVTGDITSLTENAVPQGRSFVSIASLLPKTIIDVHSVILPRGSGNQAELYVAGNDTELKMRGGTVNQVYQFTFTYITAS